MESEVTLCEDVYIFVTMIIHYTNIMSGIVHPLKSNYVSTKFRYLRLCDYNLMTFT
jgi:hypothetical protein